ncbi:MAG: hypothetical protein WC828_00005 [Thermoleophilia bacterium]|jgi:phosphoglycerol transferase
MGIHHIPNHIASAASNSKTRAVAIYVLTVVLSLLTLAWVLKLWQANLSIPFTYDGNLSSDEFPTAMHIKGIIENGWYLRNNMVGAPAGLEMFDFPMADNLHFLLMKFIALFTDNWAVVVNLFYLATFPLTVITGLFVFRRLQISNPLAAIGSILFAFLPYHFNRGEVHVFLSGIYIIPLSLLVILRISSGSSPFIKGNQAGGEDYDFYSLRSLGYVLIALLTASAGVYYAFFAGFFLVLAGIYAAYNHKSFKRLVAAGIVIAIIAAGLIVNILPSLVYQHINGRNPEAAVRLPNESLSYGVTITSMIYPVPGHRIDFANRMTANAIKEAPAAPWSSSLGLIGASGLLFLFGWLVLARGRESHINKPFLSMLDSLSVLNISAFLLAVAGGFSLTFALIVTPQIRAYNRIGIYVGFFSILAVMLLLEILRLKYVKTDNRRALYYGFLFIILVGGILDQTTNQMVPDYASHERSFLSDQAFVRKIGEVLPKGAMVFQLPYIAFPEYPAVNKMSDYNHLRGYLHSETLRWSYPAMRGRDGDQWQREIASKPTDQMVTELAAAGFSGIYINRNGYSDRAAQFEQQLRNILKEKPITNEDGSLVFFDMSSYAGKTR